MPKYPTIVHGPPNQAPLPTCFRSRKLHASGTEGLANGGHSAAQHTAEQALKPEEWKRAASVSQSVMCQKSCQLAGLPFPACLCCLADTFQWQLKFRT
jgi:hypothetical protein